MDFSRFSNSTAGDIVNFASAITKVRFGDVAYERTLC